MDSTFVCLLVLVLVCVGALVVIGNNASRAQHELQQARANYDAALGALRKTPHDASKRQSALMLGRSYSNLTRERKGVTLFDEMALMNDINTALPRLLRQLPRLLRQLARQLRIVWLSLMGCAQIMRRYL